MRYRIVRADFLHTGQGKFAGQIILPVSRAFPSFALHGSPAIGKPEARLAVTTLAHKREVFSIGHQPIGQRVRLQ
jgi:hypothetical protein